jgi:hypothetical protein
VSFLLAGGALLVGGARPALAAPPIEEDAALRLGASTELVANSFYYRALASGRFIRREREELRRARLAEQRHYTALVAEIGPTAPTADDLDLHVPARAFASRAAAIALGSRLERALLGIHLTAVAALSTPELRSLVGRMAASEAAHLAYLGNTVGSPLPSAVDVERATSLLAPYWG